MKIGDLVQYRSWRPGDLDPDEIPEISRSWDDYGIVIEITSWANTIHGRYDPSLGPEILEGEGIVFLNQHGDQILAWKKDLNILKPA